MENDIKELKKTILKMTKEISDLTQRLDNAETQKEKQSRNYTQNQTFTERVTFRGPVYNKAGTKVIN